MIVVVIASVARIVALLSMAALCLAACGPRTAAGEGGVTQQETATPAEDPREAEWTRQRHQLVERALKGRDIIDERVLEAMRAVPRHHYVPAAYLSYAYADHPLPIGHDQTISQPYIVALMTQLLELDGDETVLEIGTGSGYQAAVLGKIVATVHTIEIVQPLCESAAKRLTDEGFDNVHVHCGDGYGGWPDAAPFDAVIVTAAPEHVPQPLVDQLAPGGHLVIPVGPRGWSQELKVLSRDADGNVTERTVLAVAFVPMTGEADTGGAEVR